MAAKSLSSHEVFGFLRPEQVKAISDDAEVICIKSSTLQRLMDDDHSVGYPIQRMISQTYFKRYVDTMQKLQATIQALPLTSG